MLGWWYNALEKDKEFADAIDYMQSRVGFGKNTAVRDSIVMIAKYIKRMEDGKETKHK